MENKIPLYKIKVNPEDESGVYMVSLVDFPAIEEDWIKLSKQIEIKFSADKDRQLLYGPLLIPNKMIYRRDEKTGYEYNIMFDEEVIEIIAEKFNKNKFNDQFNFQHSDQMVNAYLKENWLIENPDKSKKYGFDLPDGTWFGAVKVEDKEFWDKYVKGEEVKGFSVEIKADAELVELSHNKINKNTEMENTNLGMVKRDDGVEIYFDGEEVGVGTPLFLDPEMTEKAPEGEHTLENGVKVILDAEGKIVEIIEKEEEVVEEEMSEETTDEVKEVEEELSFEEKVMSVVQPLFDQFVAQNAELVNKLTELETKFAEKGEEMATELKSQIEELSKMAGAETITKKSDDRKIKLEEELSSRINTIRKFR